MTRLWICSAATLFFLSNLLASGWAFELNDDGRTLIREASMAYSSDMDGRPVITDPDLNTYITSLANRLKPKGKTAPTGVTLRMTVIESPKPELYAYVDGHVVITSGTMFSMDNEAQLTGVLSHEIAHVFEGYYITMYQEIKAAERAQRRRAAAGALFGALLDVAVDYAVEWEDINQTERFFEEEATYSETMHRMAAVHAAQSAYYSIKDVVANIPAEDPNGNPIDPRLRFEPVADAQGMIYVASAGYDVNEVPKGWNTIHRINSRLAREQEQLMGPWASQLKATQGLMEMNMIRLRQQLGASGLVQALSNAPPSRAGFVATLTRLEEVKAAEKTSKKIKGEKTYRAFIQKALLPRAERYLEEENFEQAYLNYRLLCERGIRTAPVAYGMAKSRLGDFAFGASKAELKEAEFAYREVARLDPTYAAPYRGLGELYEDTDRYEDAAGAYRKYLKLEPTAGDRKRIERKIKVMERKANR